MRGRIVNSEYLEDNGYTIIEKATPYGTFIGEVKVHPEDRDIATAWDGAHFAEMKCDIAAMNEKAKMMRQRAIGAENALKTLDNINLEDRFDAYTLDMLDKQVQAMYREADKYRAIYEEMRDSYKAYTEYSLNRRRKLREKIKKENEN